MALSICFICLMLVVSAQHKKNVGLPIQINTKLFFNTTVNKNEQIQSNCSTIPFVSCDHSVKKMKET